MHAKNITQEHMHSIVTHLIGVRIVGRRRTSPRVFLERGRRRRWWLVYVLCVQEAAWSRGWMCVYIDAVDWAG
jgi:hypothetical protein